MHIEKPKPKVGLVIGSGGIKPMGLISLFELFEARQLKPDVIIGCSGGSILASGWVNGTPVATLKNFIGDYQHMLKNEPLIKKINYRTLLSLGNYPGGRFSQSAGILNGDWLIDFFKEKLGGVRLLENCSIKTILQATNFETGEAVALQHGPMAEAIYASCALYPILPPIQLNGQWLVDGAYHSALPVMEAIRQGCDKIIAISFEEKKATNFGGFFEFYMEFVSQVLNKNARKQNAFAVHFHHDEILFINIYFDKVINFWDIKSVAYIHETTALAIQKHEEAILSMFLS